MSARSGLDWTPTPPQLPPKKACRYLLIRASLSVCCLPPYSSEGGAGTGRGDTDRLRGPPSPSASLSLSLSEDEDDDEDDDERSVEAITRRGSQSLLELEDEEPVAAGASTRRGGLSLLEEDVTMVVDKAAEEEDAVDTDGGVSGEAGGVGSGEYMPRVPGGCKGAPRPPRRAPRPRVGPCPRAPAMRGLGARTPSTSGKRRVGARCGADDEPRSRAAVERHGRVAPLTRAVGAGTPGADAVGGVIVGATAVGARGAAVTWRGPLPKMTVAPPSGWV